LNHHDYQVKLIFCLEFEFKLISCLEFCSYPISYWSTILLDLIEFALAIFTLLIFLSANISAFKSCFTPFITICAKGYNKRDCPVSRNEFLFIANSSGNFMFQPANAISSTTLYSLSICLWRNSIIYGFSTSRLCLRRTIDQQSNTWQSSVLLTAPKQNILSKSENQWKTPAQIDCK